MPRTHRISRAEFPRKPARRASGALISVSLSPLEGGASAKFTCVVSKKIAQRAVDRNRLKRRCREAVGPLVSGLDRAVAVVLYPKREALGASFGDLSAEIGRLLRQLTR